MPPKHQIEKNTEGKMPMVKTILAANLKLIEKEGVLCVNCNDKGCPYCGVVESDPTNNVLEYLALRDKAEKMVW